MKTTRLIHQLTLLLAIISLTSCGKSSPFTGQTYRSFDNREAIRFTSATELELQSQGANLICQYSFDGTTVRVTADVLGTKQAFYYTSTPDGLRGSDGTFLLSPEKYAAAQEQARVARERQEQQRREAEQRRLAQEARQRAAFEERKNQFRSWLRTYFAKGEQHQGVQTSSYHRGDAPYSFRLTLTDEPTISSNGDSLTFQAFGKLHWLGHFDDGEGTVGGPPHYYPDLDRVHLTGAVSLAQEPFNGTFKWTFIAQGQEYIFNSFTYDSVIYGQGFLENGMTLQPVVQRR